MEINYKAEDFTPHGIITKDVIEHVLDNVEHFVPRYYLATERMEYLRCGLDYADTNLAIDIRDAALGMFDWDEDNIPNVFYDDLEYVFG